MHYEQPYDMTVHYREEKVTPREVYEEIEALGEKYGIKAERADIYEKMTLPVRQQENSFVVRHEEDEAAGIEAYAEDYELGIMTLEEYNHIENREISLGEGEVLIYCSGRDYGYDSVIFYGKEFSVKEEPDNFFPDPKAEDNAFGAGYLMVVQDDEVKEACIRAWGVANGVEDMESFLESGTQYVQILLEGKDSEKQDFLREFGQWCQSRPGFSRLTNGAENRNDQEIMYGALLFIGILFGMIFFMCLILIMYYKQIAEGYEDRDSFDIMQKVGMSDGEIRTTIRRQILTVFALPLIGAISHTVAGMFMVKGMMAVLSLHRSDILIFSTVGVIGVFVAVYGASYMMTARTYYRIVRQGGAN